MDRMEELLPMFHQAVVNRFYPSSWNNCRVLNLNLSRHCRMNEPAEAPPVTLITIPVTPRQCVPFAPFMQPMETQEPATMKKPWDTCAFWEAVFNLCAEAGKPTYSSGIIVDLPRSPKAPYSGAVCNKSINQSPTQAQQRLSLLANAENSGEGRKHIGYVLDVLKTNRSHASLTGERCIEFFCDDFSCKWIYDPSGDQNDQRFEV
jgi:hypothetical protein